MNKLIHGFGLHVLLCLGAVALVAVSRPANCQDYVGVLPELLNPEVGQRLALTEEQTASVRAVISQRMNAAVGLAQQLREAPVDQQKKIRADFNAESERLGFALLDQKQQADLKKIRVQWLGMLSLEEEAVAKALNLAEWQLATVAEWVGKVRDNRRGPDAQKTRDDAERGIRKALSESQWGAWQVLAGEIPVSEAGPPMPPAPEEAGVAKSVAAAGPVQNAAVPINSVRLTINFQGEPWENVLKWLAAQADMALQSDVLPPGSFSYRDQSRTYSVGEAMDIMNASLLNSGYTLVRRQRMLKCIDLEQKISPELIAQFADFIRTPEELALRGDFEPVRYLFTLSRLDPETSKKEIEAMLSIQGTVVSLPSAGQVIVTDTAGVIKGIAEMIRRAEDPTSARGSTIVQFELKHIAAEEVLAAARPLLGLPGETNISPDLSLATDTFGTVIYGTGKADKLQQLRDLVLLMDVAPTDEQKSSGVSENTTIQRHKIRGGDSEIAYQVVSQLLAGLPDVHLAKDEVAKMLVLQARSAEHKMVEETLATLAGESSEFEVIQLVKLDPQLAIAAIKKFFGLTDTAKTDGTGPVIDGDLLARQVWVKGTATEVQKIRDLVEKLEKNAAATNTLIGDNVRLIPLSGQSAARALEQMQEVWKATNVGRNALRVITTSQQDDDTLLPQRAVAPDRKREKEVVAPTPDKKEARRTIILERGQVNHTVETAPVGRFARTLAQTSQESAAESTAENTASERNTEESKVGSDIVIMQGPGGLMVTSEDKEALEQFDRLLRMLAEQAALGSSDPTIFYLKHIKASAGKELLETILSGTTASSSSGGGSLLGDLAGGVLGGGMFGALLGGGGSSGGSSLTTSSAGVASGDYSITADPRLNALIVNASARDLSMVEQLLKIIDQVESPITIETRGQIAVIPVVTVDVAQVLTMLKQLYADRIEGAAASGGGGGNRQPSPQEFMEALRGGGGGSSGRGGRGGSSELKESKIALSAETNTNSIFVIAQPQDIEEIRNVIEILDLAGGGDAEETVAVVPAPGIMNSKTAGAALQRALGSKAKVNTTPETGQAPSSQQGGSAPSPSDAETAQRRAEFFQRMQQGGFGGAPGGSRGSSGGGGFPGFGGGSRGGAPGGGSTQGRGGR